MHTETFLSKTKQKYHRILLFFAQFISVGERLNPPKNLEQILFENKNTKKNESVFFFAFDSLNRVQPERSDKEKKTSNHRVYEGT